MSDDVKQEEGSSTSEEHVQESDTSNEQAPASEIDYKAEAEAYKAKLEHANQIAEKRLEAIKRLQSSKYERAEDEDEEDTDDPRQVVRKELESWKRSQLQDSIESELEAMTDDPHERELVKLVYENEIKQTGFTKRAIQSDLKKALAIANLPKLEAQMRNRIKAEVAKSSAQDATMSTGAVSGGSGRAPLQKKEPPMSAGEKAFMDFVGSIERRIKR